jgi:hypothetical protein
MSAYGAPGTGGEEKCCSRQKGEEENKRVSDNKTGFHGGLNPCRADYIPRPCNKQIALPAGFALSLPLFDHA